MSYKAPTIPDFDVLHGKKRARPVSGYAVALAKHEGPQAAARKRPQISPGAAAPARTALQRRAYLEGTPRELIRAQGLGPALVRKQSRRSIGGTIDYGKLTGQSSPNRRSK